MNPINLSDEEKQNLLTKREAIRKRLKEKGQDTITLEEQRVFIECQQAFRTEKFQLAKEEKAKKPRKKKSDESSVDLFNEEVPKVKIKKLTKKEKERRIKELEVQKWMGILDAEEEKELEDLQK